MSLLAALGSGPAAAEVESWYAYWGIGLASNNYPDSIESALGRADAEPGTERLPLSMEVLGFYWPLAGTNTLVGGVLSIASEDVALSDGTQLVVANQHLYAFSAMHFWGDEPGLGFFVRGDIGRAELDFEPGAGSPALHGTGTGLLFAAGYGFPVSEGARLVLGISYSAKVMSDEAYSTVALNVAALW